MGVCVCPNTQEISPGFALSTLSLGQQDAAQAAVVLSLSAHSVSVETNHYRRLKVEGLSVGRHCMATLVATIAASELLHKPHLI